MSIDKPDECNLTPMSPAGMPNPVTEHKLFEEWALSPAGQEYFRKLNEQLMEQSQIAGISGGNDSDNDNRNQHQEQP